MSCRSDGQGLQAAGPHQLAAVESACNSIIVFSWGYLIWGGTIATIWPLFGTANQLLASIALATMTTWLVNHRKGKYAWCTLIPAIFVLVTTVAAGVLSIQNVFWPMAMRPGSKLQGWIETGLMAIFIVGAIALLARRESAAFAPCAEFRHRRKNHFSTKRARLCWSPLRRIAAAEAISSAHLTPSQICSRAASL
jgi:carbon starvation protein CstA